MIGRASRAATKRWIVIFENRSAWTSSGATSFFVGADATTGKLAGFHTLAAAGVPLGDLPADLSKRMPRYPLVPVVLVGRLAVDRSYQDRKLGGALIWDAVSRSIRSDVAVAALAVDAKDDAAKAFHMHLGLVALSSEGKQLVLHLRKSKHDRPS